ncbi:hypothetical protein [Vibrio owensii]|uniref:hypothetical protein n=1 Tax=Vibrio owensii TaxID=696485 RepID=UPI00215D4817|nr:hypothetical protein [Vibrio owensii]MCR9939903.1 hypothetical protein [Vibrio owensii]
MTYEKSHKRKDEHEITAKTPKASVSEKKIGDWRLEIGDWRRINTEGYEGEDTESKKEAEAPFFL